MEGMENLKTEQKRVYSPEKNAETLRTLFDLRLRAMHGEIGNLQGMEDEIGAFVDTLKKKYGNPGVEKYAMWHALAGSSIDPKREALISNDDFPGDDSVEKFVNDLVNRYDTK
jgi:hypothetical protein